MRAVLTAIEVPVLVALAIQFRRLGAGLVLTCLLQAVAFAAWTATDKSIWPLSSEHLSVTEPQAWMMVVRSAAASLSLFAALWYVWRGAAPAGAHSARTRGLWWGAGGLF